jgi:SNF2 family DNA or RNA helicase
MFTKFGMDKILKDIQDMYDKKRVEDLVNVSVKTKFLFELMAQLKKEGHRVLIFSMSKQMLDLLELMIDNNPTYKKDFTYQRIDGDTEIAAREQMCKDFNGDESMFCCLLTTKVGGFGLNLTGADRAIILDPDWNPANDNQAVDRCYRIG